MSVVDVSNETWLKFHNIAYDIFNSLNLDQQSRTEVLDMYYDKTIVMLYHKLGLGIDELTIAARYVDSLKQKPPINYPKQPLSELAETYKGFMDNNLAFSLDSFIEAIADVLSRNKLRDEVNIGDIDKKLQESADSLIEEDEDRILMEDLQKSLSIGDTTSVYDIATDLGTLLNKNSSNVHVAQEMLSESNYKIKVEDIIIFKQYASSLFSNIKKDPTRVHRILEHWLNNHVVILYNQELISDSDMKKIISIAEQLDIKYEDAPDMIGDESKLELIYAGVLEHSNVFNFQFLISAVHAEHVQQVLTDPLPNGTEVLVKDLISMGDSVLCTISGRLPERFIKNDGMFVYVVTPLKPIGDYSSYVTERFNIKVVD